MEKRGRERKMSLLSLVSISGGGRRERRKRREESKTSLFICRPSPPPDSRKWEEEINSLRREGISFLGGRKQKCIHPTHLPPSLPLPLSLCFSTLLSSGSTLLLLRRRQTTNGSLSANFLEAGCENDGRRKLRASG